MSTLGNKKRVIWISVMAATVVAAAVTAAVLLTPNSTKTQGTDAAHGEDSYFLAASPTNLLSSYAARTTFNNDFFYFENIGSDDEHILVEYDLQSGSTATITIESEAYCDYTCFTVYEGAIYAVRAKYSQTNLDVWYSIVKIDYNSGAVTEVYAPAEKNIVIGCMTVGENGKLYFIEGAYDAEHVDSDGYLLSYSLYEYSLSTNQKSEILKANTYYITDGVIYFTRLHVETDTVRLFYAAMDFPETVTNTGIDLGINVSDDFPYMYYPHDGKVYFANHTYQLSCYDVETKTTEVICSFGEESYVRYYQFFNGKLVLLVREPCTNGNAYMFGLYTYDEDYGVQKIVDDEQFNEGRLYMFEWIDYMTIFNGCDDYFLLFTYSPDVDNAVYLINKDFEMEKIYEEGAWNYDAYQAEQLEIAGMM